MNEETLLIIVLMVSGLTLFGLLAMAGFIHRMYRKHAGYQDSHLSRLSEGQRHLLESQDRLREVVHPLLQSNQPIEGVFAQLGRLDDNQRRMVEEQRHLSKIMRPIVACSRPMDNVVTRLSFADSLDPERFAATSEECALGLVNRVLARTGDGITLTVNSLRLVPSGVEMTVSASREGQVLLSQGTAVISRHGRSGRALPVLRDSSTGKFIENMKGVPAATALSRLGAMSSAVVGAAHIVSGADIAHRLKLIDRKVNLLLACRRIDHLAKLERIYTAASELGSGAMNRDKCWELWRLRGELRELRYTWRRELQHHLNLIDDPATAPWFARVFTRQRTSDSIVHTSITEGLLQLTMIEYSMRLDQTLAVGSGTISEFERTLAGELIELQTVADLLAGKAEMISGRYPDLSVESTVKGMNLLIEQYRRVLPRSPDALERTVVTAITQEPGRQETGLAVFDA
jgi:hypothetical protein